jgi:hypothetical protein
MTAIASASTTAKATVTSVAPNPVNELDCNGWSSKYGTVRKLAGNLCTDPIKIVNGKASRFIDNKWYVGHDEPSVKFISSQPGSGNTMTYVMKLSKDPKKLPTPSGSVTDYGQLSVAPWFGLPMCDPNSYPENPCTPDSDTNSGSISDPNAAGSAFMELQFYPPGFTRSSTAQAAARPSGAQRSPSTASKQISISQTSTPTARSRSTSHSCRLTASPPARPARS